MAPFNFQPIQTLDITEQDNPSVDIHNGMLILTAERGQERIIITAPIDHLLPKTSATVVKTPKKTKTIVARKEYKTKPPRNSGSANPISKLDENIVRRIRALCSDKAFVNRYPHETAMHEDIAKQYNVTAAAIYQVHKNLTWKHVI
jgi:hypothetical protein